MYPPIPHRVSAPLYERQHICLTRLLVKFLTSMLPLSLNILNLTEILGGVANVRKQDGSDVELSVCLEKSAQQLTVNFTMLHVVMPR